MNAILSILPLQLDPYTFKRVLVDYDGRLCFIKILLLFFQCLFFFVPAFYSEYRPPLRGVPSLQKEILCRVCQGSSQSLVQLDIHENWTVRMLR